MNMVFTASTPSRHHENGYEATRRLVEKFVELGVNHMVVGGLSSNAYGIPRSTKDADTC
jgi:predicted Rossmann-fold nucleotide-binding protein